MSDDGRFHVSAKSVALGASLAALASLSLLAIVATIKDADALSVVALALAILAFAIQIIVYIAQATAASAQERRFGEIYNRTTAALAAIEEKTEGTRQTVSTMNDRMVDALLGTAITKAADSGVSLDAPEFRDLLSGMITEHLSDRERQTSRAMAIQQQLTPSRTYKRPSLLELIDPPFDRMVVQFPSVEEIAEIVPIISGLGPNEAYDLDQLGRNHFTGGLFGDGRIVGRSRASRELHSRGLTRRILRRTDNEPVYVLTEPGLVAARAILGDSGDRQVPEQVKEVREAVERKKSLLRQTLETALKADSDDTPIVD